MMKSHDEPPTRRSDEGEELQVQRQWCLQDYAILCAAALCLVSIFAVSALAAIFFNG